ncbi:transposase family protein [Microcoleus sp. AR_TQ3_B6]|uniref:transposase family protein n=1 Tax=Microcoleus sp. AR_TQ3_B6 TaxID=3055284 RepID=UPI002FD4E998
MYRIAGGDARRLTYFTCFSCTLLLIARSLNPDHVICDQLFSNPYLDNNNKKAIGPDCGKKTDKLHQNHYYVVSDLPFGEQKVYLQVNRRPMRCEGCPKKFSEDLEFVKKTRTYTQRLKKKILSELLESELKNMAQRNRVSEQEIETLGG